MAATFQLIATVNLQLCKRYTHLAQDGGAGRQLPQAQGWRGGSADLLQENKASTERFERAMLANPPITAIAIRLLSSAPGPIY